MLHLLLGIPILIFQNQNIFYFDLKQGIGHRILGFSLSIVGFPAEASHPTRISSAQDHFLLVISSV